MKWGSIWVAIVLGCGGEAAAPRPVVCSDAPEPEASPGPTWDDKASLRAAPTCAFAAGDMTSKTLGANPTPDAVIPSTLKHVVVLMHENHSFDNYLGQWQAPAGETVDVAPSDASNPNPANPGSTVPRYHEPRYCIADTDHEWSASHWQYDHGRMDGFVASNNNTGTNSGGERAMGYYDRSDIPLYYWLADNFSTSDRYFSALLGPTHSNIMFYYRATSCGYAEGIDTNPDLVTRCGVMRPTIFSELDDKHVTNRVYSDNFPATGAAAVLFGAYDPTHGVGTIDDFIAAANADKLPSVSFVEPNYGKVPGETEDDEHPPTNIQIGQRFSFRVLSSLMASPSWPSTIVFLTWDEHGGYYDHFAPPSACPPDASTTYDFRFDRYGFRVPLIAVSPFARHGHVSHIFADHTSITRFIEHWQGLPAMSGRDANAWPLLDMFDFTQANSTPPPAPSLAPESTDPVHTGTCGGTGGTGMP